MSERYDAIIVGGGFAGLCCALKLRGRRILLLETRREIGRKHRACQCGLYPLAETFLIRGDDITFQHNDFTVPGGVKARVRRMETVSGGHRIVSSFGGEMPLLDEAKTKQTLENLCRAAGVHVVTGAKVRLVETDGRTVSVQADRKYEASFLVGADGAESRVAKSLPVRRRRIGGIFALDIEAEHMVLPPDCVYGEMRDFKTGLYAQPYGGGFMLGVYQGAGLRDKRIDLKQYLAEASERLQVKGVTARYGCYLPMHTAADRARHQNVILAGDAAAAFSMATISGALMAGLLAGEAVADRLDGSESAFADYDRRWRRTLKQRGLGSIRHLSFLLNRLNEKRMGRLARALSGQDLAKAGAGFYLRRLPRLLGAFV